MPSQDRRGKRSAPISTRRSATLSRILQPGIASKVSASARISPSARAASVMAVATGCSDPDLALGLVAMVSLVASMQGEAVATGYQTTLLGASGVAALAALASVVLLHSGAAVADVPVV